jgi:hypothetical protein
MPPIKRFNFIADKYRIGQNASASGSILSSRREINVLSLKAYCFVEFIQALGESIRIYKKHGVLNLFFWRSSRRCHAETIKACIPRRVTDDGELG